MGSGTTADDDRECSQGQTLHWPSPLPAGIAIRHHSRETVQGGRGRRDAWQRRHEAVFATQKAVLQSARVCVAAEITAIAKGKREPLAIENAPGFTREELWALNRRVEWQREQEGRAHGEP